VACCLQQHQDDNRIIAALARENHDLREKVKALEESERRSRSWLDDAKRAAGFHSNVSFDDVWAKALKAYLDLQKPDKG
jgi:hypothetical protein